MRRSLFALALGLAFLSCEVSNPVAPPDSPVGDGGAPSGSGSAEFDITITLPEQTDVIVDALNPILITITVETADGKTVSPAGQTFAVTTTLGGLDEPNKKEFKGALDDSGEAVVNFFPGNAPGDAQLLVSVGNTVGTRLITVKPLPEAPVADFMAQISNLKVLFTNMSTGSNLTSRWNFGDGCMFDEAEDAPTPCTGCPEGSELDVCTQTDPVREYAKPAAYAVKLTVRDGRGRPSDRTQLIDVGTLPEPPMEPIAMFTAEPEPGGLTVIFRDASTGPPTSWLWDFGDGNGNGDGNGDPNGDPNGDGNGCPECTQQNPVHTFPNAGQFSVSLTVNNSTNTPNTSTQFVPVGADIPELKADFTFLVSASGLTVTFTDASTGEPDSYLWNFGDGDTSTQQNPIHEYVRADEYEVALTVNKAGKPASTARKLVAAGAPPPTADFTFSCNQATSPDTGQPEGPCQGLRVVFNDASAGEPTGWTWDFGDGAVVSCDLPEDGSCRNLFHDYTVSGSYAVNLEVRNTGGISDTTKLIKVESGETPPTSLFTFDKLGGLTVQFDGSKSTGNNLSYTWDFGDVNSPDNSSENVEAIHTFSAPDDYLVKLTVANGEGTSVSSQTVRFTVPKADFSFRQSGTSGIFTDQSSGGPVEWTWTFADSAGVAIPPPPENPRTITTPPGDTTYDFKAAGTYQVTLEVKNVDDETDEVTKTITINP